MNLKEINSQAMLRVGTILRGIYRIDSYLSSGGFGNTYVATNIEFDERVAIKEFFMKGVTQRDDNQTTVSVSNSENIDSFQQQKEKFKKEARRIRQLKNEHIVTVHDLFEENGTAYYVMDYVDGENLAERLKRTGEPMSEQEVRDILPQILDALKAVHDAGIWHLDLKPANIMLTKEGQVKLIDFGASKQLNAQKGGATTSTAISYTNGYAPREQMEQNYDKFGPWTDIYALGATLYNLLTNKCPPLPTDIDDDVTSDKHEALPFSDCVSDELKSLILKMINPNRLLRPQSVSKLINSEETRIFLQNKDTYQKQESLPHKNIIETNEEATIIGIQPQKSIEQNLKHDSHSLEPISKKAKEKNQKSISLIKFAGVFVLLCIFSGYFIIGIININKKDNSAVSSSNESDILNNSINEYVMAKADSLDIKRVNIQKHSKRMTAIDLGLPSGTKWADRNIGASTPIDYGGLYRYGNPYTKIDGSNNNFSEEKNIIGTKNDVAVNKLGGKWRTPSIEQINELITCCKSALIMTNNKKVMAVFGPNGNYILLPLAGCMFNFGRCEDQMWGLYEAGNLTADWRSVQLVVSDDGRVDKMDSQSPGYYGCSIRPVETNNE